MIRRIVVTCAVIILASTGVADPPSLLESEPITASLIRDWILHLESMPCGRAYEVCDPNLWQIVRLGLEHVPTILELVDDDTDTEMLVCLFGGNYAVGDVAVISFLRIIQSVPVALMAAGGDQEAFDRIGFGTYWQFVRESQDNRDSMRRFLEEWFASNRSRLEWVRLHESPAGGYYQVGPDDPA
jgi:hypothetical protein